MNSGVVLRFAITSGAFALGSNWLAVPVVADGYKSFPSFGVNRRVVSSDGHVKVKGKFTVQTFELPKVPGKNPPVYTTPRVPLAGVAGSDGRPRKVRVDSKPTFYLGFQGGKFPAEAGFQFESIPVDEWTGPTPDPGWIVFMRWHPKIHDPNFPSGYWIQLPVRPGHWANWRHHKTHVEHTMQLELRPDKKLALTVFGIGPDGSNMTLYSVPPKLAREAQSAFSPSLPPEAAAVSVVDGSISASKYRVRRVVGITQGNAVNIDKKKVGFHGYVDNSRFTIKFSKGEVAQADGQFHPWTSDRVQHSESGFDNKNKIAGSAAAAGTSQFIVEFPRLGSPDVARSAVAAATALKEDGVSRYSQETTQFNLFKR